jgi:hypothetical protein
LKDVRRITSVVITEEGKSLTFDVATGVRQGRLLSCILFDVLMDAVVRTSSVSASGWVFRGSSTTRAASCTPTNALLAICAGNLQNMLTRGKCPIRSNDEEVNPATSEKLWLAATEICSFTCDCRLWACHTVGRRMHEQHETACAQQPGQEGKSRAAAAHPRQRTRSVAVGICSCGWPPSACIR